MTDIPAPGIMTGAIAAAGTAVPRIPPSDIAIEVEGLTKSFAGRVVVRNLTMKVRRGLMTTLHKVILDDQDRVRRHVAIYINGERIADRSRLTDPVGESDEVFVFQALSGG